MGKSKSRRYRVKVLGAIAFIAFLIVWLGVPTYQQWRADRRVDELCAKDGGVTVYETVRLPAEQFNRWGQFEVRDKRSLKSDDAYYSVTDYTNIEGKRESDDIEDLVIYRRNYSVYRRSDEKLLGESISYVRRGGDPVGPWHPSSYRCPKPLTTETKIFKASNE